MTHIPHPVTVDPTGYQPDKVLVAVPYGGNPTRNYVLICLLCPPDDHTVPLHPPNSTLGGYPTLGTLAWVARDHWRQARHPGWVERR